MPRLKVAHHLVWGNTKNNSTRTPANTNIGITENYTVRSGDSLTMLSNRFGVAIGDLATANGLASNANLRIGQTLKVPKLTTTYTVKAGDGLYRFGTTLWY